ncbi:hypothetical protein DMB68_08410 [Flavobacterium hydrophilum]|uniref:Uncharacterized protein n=1 Tax=Flavobacterium hydrophilum TaxID=2211445 RepID=A0A2V4C7V8_9FLAO|nr:hypothetical protein DMB68_08410 [Flavobacterium hydrophilum]
MYCLYYFYFFNVHKKAKYYPLAPIKVEILLLFSLKSKRLQRKAGRCLLKKTNHSASKISNRVQTINNYFTSIILFFTLIPFSLNASIVK